MSPLSVCVCVCTNLSMCYESMNYRDLLTNPHQTHCVCVCVWEHGGVFVRALLWHMHVQSCLITDQALRQRQTLL